MNKSNLENLYNNDLVPLLLKELEISNKMDVPKLKKIVLNMGLGEAKDNKNSLQQAVDELTHITGQKPMIDRFISVSSPRIRDFRGFSAKGFDGRGNYNFGINEQVVFPEIDYDKVNAIRGLNITIVTSAKNDKDAFKLLESFGFPFKKITNNQD